MNIIDEVKNIFDEMVENRRYLHKHPEIGNSLPNTTKYVKAKLEEMGYEPEEIADSSLVVLVGKNPGKTILVRADMDALDMKELTDLPFKSENDYMHSCGHDFHAAMLLGVAKILKQHENELKGQAKLIFQPAEEIMNGAIGMVKAGVLENPKVDVAMATHSFGGPVGQITYQKGVNYASSDVFRITIQGIGCHGAMPHMGIDPIVVGSHIILNLQNIRARELDPAKPVVLTIGKFQAGKACNIIPDSAVLEGTLRTFDNDFRNKAKKRLQEIVEDTGKTFNAKAEIDFMYGAPPVVTSVEITDELVGYAKEILPNSFVELIDSPVMASEDFSYIAEQVPSAFWFISGSIEGNNNPHHHPKFDLDEKLMINNTAAILHSVMRWLEENNK